MKQKNMNRYKKLLSCVLIACLCLGVIPTYVLNTRAAEDTVFTELEESDMQYQMNQLVEKGYRVVTPLTFGAKDTDSAQVNSGKAEFEVDHVLFSVNMKHPNSNKFLNYFYLSSSLTSSTARVIKLGINGYANRIYIYNPFDSTMYRGSDAKSIEKDKYFSINPSNSGVTSIKDSRAFQLWITTDFVDYNNDDEIKDDLQIGIWVDGVLCGNYYVPDCKDNKYYSHVQNADTLAVSSPIMELSDLGMDGGEYTTEEGGPYTSTLVASKNMHKTTFQTSVRFKEAGGTLYYGAESADNAVQLTSTTDGIQVLYGTEELGRITNDNVGIDVLNNNFDLKLTTAISGSDVILDVGVENKYASFTLPGAAETFKAYVGVKTEGNATVLVGDFADEDPDKFEDLEESSMQYKMNQLVKKGYQVVTPLTFGWSDATWSAVNKSDTPVVGDDISIDNLLFCADVTFDSTGGGNYTSGSNVFLYYLRGLRSSGSTGTTLSMSFANGGKSIQLGNYIDSKNTEKLYVGDAGTEVIDYGSGLKLGRAEFGLTDANTDYKSFEDTKVQLWITTEFVDMEYNDPDEDKDDLKIGIYINGVLYRAVNDSEGTHFYVPNCKQNVYSEFFQTSNKRLSISSPIMDINDMGMVGGEYATGEDGEFYTSDLVESKVMDGTTFQSSVRFKGEGGTLYYGSNDIDKAVQLTSTADGIQVTYGGKDLVLINESNVGIDVLNNIFDLKLTTKIIDSDVNLDISVDNKYKSFTLKGAAETFKAYVGVKTTGDATVLVGEFGNDVPEQVYWCLDNGAYTKTVTSSIKRISVDGSVPEVFELTEPGSYSVAVTKNDKIYMEDVIVYIGYDINGNQEVEITDLVHMLKVENETTHDETIANLSEVQRKAIGYENEATWADTPEYGELVLGFMREALIGGIPTVTREKEVTALNVDELTEFIESHGAYTNDFSIKVSESEFVNDIWLLTCEAKYISVNGKQPTIEYKIIDAEGDALYTSPAYVVGEENESVLRQWRVMPTKEDYSTVEINIVIPDGVALFIDEFYNTGKDNVLVTRTDADIEYASHTGLRYAPTNTKEAFEWAGEVEYDRMITIVKFTAPTTTDPLGVPVCLHDDYVQGTLRLKDGSAITSSSEYYNKPIEEFTYQELIDNFSAGWRMNEIYGDAVVPTLKDFFEACKKYDMDPIFSVHPNLSIEQWNYVKELLVEYDLLDKFYVKSGDDDTLKDTFSVFGFDIGGYQILVGKNSTSNPYIIAKKAGLVDAYGEVYFDKVEAEFFNTNPNLLDLIEEAKSNGFERISLYCEDKFNGPDFTRLMELGVNEFNVDYHASMGLKW